MRLSSKTLYMATVSIVVLIVGAVSAWALTNYQSIEAESSLLSGQVATVDDSSSSNGQAVKFGAAPEACQETDPFVPGGPDPWGGCWPGPANTGVPAGTVLTPYTDSCTVTVAGTVIDSKTIDCVLSIRAADVVITNSQINGRVEIHTYAPEESSFSISDSSIHITSTLDTGLARRNFTANRVDITGGRRSAYCASNCLIEDSWVHGQGMDPEDQAHFSGLRMEQQTTYRHNSITCEAYRGESSGCSAGLTGYGDFAVIEHNLIERNLFYVGEGGGMGTCAYGGSTPNKPYSEGANNIRFISNRFVRSPSGHCGTWYSILQFDENAPGNQWIDNLFDDGEPVPVR